MNLDLATARRLTRLAIDAGSRALSRRARLAHAYQRLYDMPEGKLVIDDILREAGLLSVADNPEDSRFYDGKRAVGLMVIHRLRWSEAELVELAREQTTGTLNDLEAR